MSISRTRRLWPTTLLWLAIIGLLAVCVALLQGAGRDPHWLAPQPGAVARAASVAAGNVADLPEQRLALIWRQPLFSPTRETDQATARAADSGLAGVLLGGVIIDGPAQWALLRQGQRSLKLKVGERLENGWRLERLTGHEAIFSYQGQQRRLSLAIPRLPAPGAASIPRLPAPSVQHTDAPQEAEPPVIAP